MVFCPSSPGKLMHPLYSKLLEHTLLTFPLSVCLRAGAGQEEVKRLFYS